MKNRFNFIRKLLYLYFVNLVPNFLKDLLKKNEWGFIVSNDRFYKEKNNFYNSNKNTFTIINCFRKFKKVNLIGRNSKEKLRFKEKFYNTKIITYLIFLKKKKKLNQKEYL